MQDDIPGVHSDPEILGGTPVFVGTRVPVRASLDYLKHDLQEYPGDDVDSRGPSLWGRAAVAGVSGASSKGSRL